MSAGKVKNILYPEQKIKIMESFGVDYLFNIPFTEEICHMNPTDYVDKILIEKFKMKEVYCGFNYRLIIPSDTSLRGFFQSQNQTA